MDFDLETYKESLLYRINNKAKYEQKYFEDIIKDYTSLTLKSHKLYYKKDSKPMNERSSFGSSMVMQTPNNEKVTELEKELAILMKENKNLNTKLLEIIEDNIKMKENVNKQSQDILSKAECIKQLTLKNEHLEDVVFKQSNDIVSLKNENATLEKSNIELSLNLKTKINENSNLINEILTIKNDYALKMNEMVEMFDEAKKKKEAADRYYDDKKTDYLNSNKYSEMTSKLDEFKIVVEETKIPNKLKNRISAHRKALTDIYFNAFGSMFLTSSADYFIKNWDASKNIESGAFTGFGSAVTGSCYDHTEQLIFGASLDRSAKLWDLKSSKLLTTFTGHIDYINVIISANSSRRGFTGSTDRTIKEWDFDSRKLTRTFASSSAVWSLCSAANDNYLYSGHSDGSLRIWSDNNNDKPEQIVDLHDDKIISIKQAKNENQLLILSKDYSICLFDNRMLSSIYRLDSTTIPHYCECSLTVSTDKRYFATGSTRGEIYVFDMEKGKLLETLDNKSKAITSICWRPFNSQLYVGDVTGFLTIWGL